MSRRGDTIVEVLLATVVLSMVLAGAFSLSNRAIQTGQAALERTEAVNMVREYAETLRYIHYSEVDGYEGVWQNIMAAVSSTKPEYSGANYCNVSVTNPIYLKLDQVDSTPTGVVDSFTLPSDATGRLLYSQATDHDPNDLVAVWLEVYDPDTTKTGVVDIHIKACWDNISGSITDRVGSVVRLSETRDL